LLRGGSPANDPEATRIARAQHGIPVRLNDEDDIAVDDDELEEVHIYGAPNFDLHQVWLRLAVIGAIILVFLLALIPVPPYISILLALSLLLIPAYYHLKRNMVRYTLTDSKLKSILA